jgi:hypothetical protein
MPIGASPETRDTPTKGTAARKRMCAGPANSLPTGALFIPFEEKIADFFAKQRKKMRCCVAKRRSLW